MAFTYDPATAGGKVRLLAGDTVDSGHVFEDAEVAAALDANDNSINYAAAMLLNGLAARLARSAGSVKSLDMQVDTRQAVKDLRDQAKALMEQEDDAGGFAIAEMVLDQQGFLEKVFKDAEREGL